MTEQKKEQVVTPWVVEGDIDYNRLIEQFGTERIDQKLIDRFEKVTGKPAHPWIKRGIFFSHRGLDKLLTAYENGEPVFLYTGRGPTSDSMHVGHMIPFMFTKWLQDVFDCPLVIQMSDTEKFFFKKLEFQAVYELGFKNAEDIIACGFNPEKTFIFSNHDYVFNCREYEDFVMNMKKRYSARQVAKIFGFGEKLSDYIDRNEKATPEMKQTVKDICCKMGEDPFLFSEDATPGFFDWPFYQSAAAFSKAFPHIFGNKPAHCLVAYAIDQDPYFRMARDLADMMKLPKPCSIMSTFIPPLTGSSGKMSSSVSMDTTLFLTDDEKTIRTKINKHAFSGAKGNGSLEDHRRLGGNTATDISYQYLRYFEMDDKKLTEIKEQFSSGQMSCSQIKTIMADKIVELIKTQQSEKKKITEKAIQEFYKMKPIKLPEKKHNSDSKDTNTNDVNKKLTTDESKLYKIFSELKINYITTYHDVITTVQEGEAVAKLLDGTICKNMLLQSAESEYFIFISKPEIKVKLGELQKKLKVKKLKFVDREILPELLGVPRDCATVFALINKSDKQINVVIDESIPTDKKVNFHPLRTDATTTISYDDLIKFVKYCGSNIL